MKHSIRGLALAVAAALLASVATQVFYITVVSEAAPDTVLRPATWLTEMAIFSLAAAAALPLTARSTFPLAASAIVLASILNMIQVGIGLSMFGHAQEAGEQVFAMVLQAAFFIFFQAKALLGLAAIGIGLAACRTGAIGRIVGFPAILAGIAAAIANLLGMAQGMAEWSFPAGAAGTVATAMLAVALLIVAAEDPTA
ncbi:hypothetical protein [Alteriqipengyuania lutimaris]|uniref:Thiamine biosynthesis protein ThiC n=1 Tax=Alteriqipengyuania lutimaris TaxID=1538146 RepID=A0A395LMA5_9SPHN|nr:hypothetical protein [Alteriqipengyuania lutimaris]MBB3033043.1 hypothetical protein [Alteriqipengyuania lutimaris]RDS77885.1 hypothetical protein DL238_09940 [Alteriqipengyuania lutimaris]